MPIQHFGYNTPIYLNMGTHMKTTLDIADTLFLNAKQVAASRNTTLRALVEEGLRLIVTRHRQTKAAPAFKLVDASVGGTVMQNIDFGRLRDLANEREFDYMATSFKQSQT